MLILLLNIGILLSAIGILSIVGLCYAYDNDLLRWATPTQILISRRLIEVVLIAYGADIICLYILLMMNMFICAK